MEHGLDDIVLMTEHPRVVDGMRTQVTTATIRQPNGVASANSYAIIGWADTRNANDLSQAQDNYATAVQFAPLPTTKNTTAPVISSATSTSTQPSGRVCFTV